MRLSWARSWSGRRWVLAAAVVAACAGASVLAYQHAPVTIKSRAHILSAQVASLDLGYLPSPLPTQHRIAASDGMLQIYVPAGEFAMGTDHLKFIGSTPEHKVYLRAFWIDQTAVTNAMYAGCVAAGACTYLYARPGYNPGYSNPLHRDSPVTFVSWDEARLYCAWAGRRLPTEAEWEKAARGTQALFYPWGSAPPDISLLNFGNYIGGTVSVYRYPRGASPYGVLQLEGNIRQWTQDWFDPNYYSVSPYMDPQGPASGLHKVLRGASYSDNERQVLAFIRFDHTPTSRGANRGFRCVQLADN